MLGYTRYLSIFSRFKVATLRLDKKEQEFFTFLDLIPENEGLIIDVGANLGFITAHIQKKFPQRTILAIEPMPEHIAVLYSLKKKLGWKHVEIIGKAVGAEKGTVTMVLPHNGKTKMQGLSHVKDDEIKEWVKGDEVEVEITTIDEIVDNQIVSAVKMDVENYEYQALLGAEKTITQNRPILFIELWDNVNRQRCFDWLLAKNYRICVTMDHQVVEFQPKLHKHQNFIFLPN